MNAPVFIIGSPRSGTTLLRLMVACHPRIVVPPEAGFAIWLRERYSDWFEYSPEVVECFVADVMATRKIETWAVTGHSLLEFVVRGQPASYARAVSLVYEWYGSVHKPEASRWGDKNNWYVSHVDAIAEMFPDAAFVHIVRDGRDVACSYRELHRRFLTSEYAPRLASDIRSIAQEWTDNVTEARQSFASREWRDVVEIRYEDLVTEPVNTLRKVCLGIGESFEPRMLEYPMLNRDEQMEPREFLQWKERTLEAPRSDAVGQHMVKLSRDERRAFERIARSTLLQYGYLVE